MKASSDLVEVVVRLLRAGEGWESVLIGGRAADWCQRCFTEKIEPGATVDRLLRHREGSIRVFINHRPMVVEVDGVVFTLSGGQITAIQHAVAFRATRHVREAALADLQRQIDALKATD